MLVGALRVFPRTVLPQHRPKSSMRQTGADSPAPLQTVHWTVCVPLWRERAVRIPSLREKQKALSPDGERAFCGRSDGIRTHGLLVPNQARYHLRYTPRKKPQQLRCCGFCLVGDERIELPRAESESAALPLCESPSHFVVGVCPQRLTIIAGVALFVNSFFYFFYLFFKCRFSVIFRFHRVDKPGPVS